jgi:hypothetical protein
MVRLLLISVLLLATASFGQEQNRCVSTSEIGALKKRMIDLFREIDNQLKQYQETTNKRTKALEVVRECQADRGLLNRIDEILTLGESGCNRSISDYNLLDQQVENLLQVIRVLQGMQKTNLMNLRIAESARCQPQ